MKTVSIYNRLLIAFLSMAIVNASCTKYPDPPAVFEQYGSDSGQAKFKKVLLISIDGATGSEVQTIAPPNISALTQTAKYSFSVNQDASLTDASSWASMLTGVSATKHGIYDSTFAISDSSGSGGDFEGTVAFYPNIYTYILQNKSEYQTAMITPWAALANYAKLADYSIAAANDAAVNDSAISVLKRAGDLGFIAVDFNEAEIAGNKGSFSASDAGYKSAILQCDTYVGNILQALKTRSNYNSEDWLVIVTTNHGGSSNTPKPGFIVYSDSAFQSQEVQKSGFSYTTFSGSGSSAVYATLNGSNVNSVYNFNNDFTIQFDMLMPTNSGSYPTFFGNKSQLNSATPGFSFIRDGGPTWTFNTTSGSKFQVKTTTSVEENAWHTLTVTYTASNRVVSTYTDGAFQSKGTAPSGINMNGTDPLAVGWQPTTDNPSNTDNVQISIHNIEIFNTALDSSTISQNICLVDLTKHPDYKNLIGFWPCDEGQGGKFQNAINPVYSFQFQGSYKWQGVSLGTPVPCSANIPAGSAGGVSIVPYTIDVAANAMYWMGINISSDWGIDGTSWLNNF